MGTGRIITFYSYKGGTGRSMALANAAWVLALNGKRVLAIDWDLEAPGLHRYFLPFLDDPELSETTGLIDLFWSYSDLVLTPKELWPLGIKDPLALANAQRHAVPLEFPFPDSNACLHFLGAGQQEAAYATRVRTFDWTAFYARLGGNKFIEKFRERSIEQYDYVLIDSRTGVADTSGICTVQLPDAVVLCYTYNRQSMMGIAAIGSSIRSQRRESVRLFPIAMRAERTIEGYKEARAVAVELLDPLLHSQFDFDSLEKYWRAAEVPHYPEYSFEETLAVFKDLPGQRNTLLSDMVWLAETVSGGSEGSLEVPILEKQIRDTFLQRFALRVSSGIRPLNEAKVIIVGRGNVGKTSLVNRLVFDKFGNTQKTDGIQITDWAVSLPEDEVVRLRVWDFGGQEIMHATHQFFLTERTLYVLVLNGRDGTEDTDAEYWLTLINSFGRESPVIIVLNKINEHAFDINRQALLRKYPFIKAINRTDCEDGYGIRELSATLVREIGRLEHLRDPFPASWFAIKEQLESTTEPYQSFGEFREICNQYGEKDETRQEALAEYLHTLGIILNYREDPRLMDFYVLNPSWVTDGIYRILNSRILLDQMGEISLEDLPSILDDRKYPARMCRFIFDLMKKFDLCFSFPDDDTRYLFPELLEKQEPEASQQFRPHDCLNFEYHYPVLLPGLFSRFIVRTHVLSENEPRWRNGVILQFEGCRALVRADLDKRKITVNITGPMVGRRRLMSVIRSDFERIHRDIKNLQPSSVIPLPGYSDEFLSYDDLLVMEQHGFKTIPKVVKGQIREFDVSELLSGIEPENERRHAGASGKGEGPTRLFVCYSHKDEQLYRELQTHLKILQHQGVIDTWSDQQLEAGDDWKSGVDENISRADIILLLVSVDFVASEYFFGKEMALALERHKRGDARVIPVIARDVNWKKSSFAGLQALPRGGKAVSSWDDTNSAWRSVSEGIEKAVEVLRKRA